MNEDNPDKCYMFMPEARTIVEYECEEDRNADISGFNGRDIPYQKMKTMEEVPEPGIYTLFPATGKSVTIALVEDKTDPDSSGMSVVDIEAAENF